jgi:hypothetical protein
VTLRLRLQRFLIESNHPPDRVRRGAALTGYGYFSSRHALLVTASKKASCDWTRLESPIISIVKTETGVPPTKRSYEPPKLTRYGTVKEITKTVGISGNYDNALHITRTTLR